MCSHTFSHSARASPISRDSWGPRTSGTMQNVQWLSQPIAIETHAWWATSRRAGSALGNTSVNSRTSIWGPSVSARRRSSSNPGNAWVPTTTSTHGARSWIWPRSFWARQPATTIRRRGFACFRGRRCPRLPYSRLSAFSRTAHVFNTTTWASVASSARTYPSDSSRPAIRSESCSFIWHPKVRIRYRPLIATPGYPRRDRGSPRELDRPGLAHHGDLDLARVLELLLHLFGDVAGHHLSLEVVDVDGLDHHPDLPPGLHGIGLLHPGVGGADLLQPLQALDVGLQALPPRSGSPARDAVGDLGQDGLDRPLLHLAVVGLDTVHDLGRLPQPAGDLRPDDGVGPLDLVGHRLADVVQQRAPLGYPLVQAELGGDGAGDVGRLDQVLQDVLPVRGPELEPRSEEHQIGMHVGDPDLHHRLLAGPLDLLVDLLLGALVRLLDAGRVDSAVGHELLQGHAGRLTPDGVEARQDDGLRGVVDDEVHPGHGLESPDVAALPADDPTLHVLGREGEYRDGRFGGLLRGHPLDGDGHDLSGSLLPFLPSLVLDLPNGGHGLALGLVDDLSDKRLLGLLRRHPGYRLELLAVLLRRLLQLLAHLLELLVAVVHLRRPRLNVGELVLDRLLLLGEALLRTLHLLTPGADLLLRFPPHAADLVLDLAERLAGELLRLPLCREDDLLDP